MAPFLYLTTSGSPAVKDKLRRDLALVRDDLFGRSRGRAQTYVSQLSLSPVERWSLLSLSMLIKVNAPLARCRT